METVIFDPKEIKEILDLRLIGCYKIKQGVSEQNLSEYYRFESPDILCKVLYICKFIKEGEWINEVKLSKLEQNDERGNMSERDILDRYVDLEKSCLTDSQKKQVMDMLYKYKDAFSLRDGIGTCPNIEIDVTDKYVFFIRLYHVKEED